MTTNATDEGAAAARNGQPRDACPHAEGSPAHGDWLSGWATIAQGDRPDAPFEQARGLSSEELADVIGADDYEAGADRVQPESNKPA